MKRIKTSEPKDNFLESRQARYDIWMKKGLISVSSKVVPVNESFKAEQWILATEQAIEILRKSRSFALTDCLCRTHYKRCSNPLEVCLMLDDAADRSVREGKARTISLNEAKAVLRQANANGLVHLTLYNPDHNVYALCSCCSCCCHDLQLLKSYGRKDLVARCDYITRTEPAKCTGCGNCIARCVFEARSLEDGEMKYAPKKCYGCGLCVATCPADATVMIRKT